MQRLACSSDLSGRSSVGVALAAVLLLLAACATQQHAPAPGTPPAGTPAPGGSSAAPSRAGPPQPTLAAEQKRLSALFEGTPVVFAMQGDGSLRVEVPLRYSFDAGSSTVKPPLAAVLDRIARSQRRASSRLLVVAPADKGGRGATLASERAGSARDYMVGHGIAATRFAVQGVAEPDLVRIVVSDTGSPRLEQPQ
jgi:outer membrane protein OmpA-like peptidoglycan-associated protein